MSSRKTSTHPHPGAVAALHRRHLGLRRVHLCSGVAGSVARRRAPHSGAGRQRAGRRSVDHSARASASSCESGTHTNHTPWSPRSPPGFWWSWPCASGARAAAAPRRWAQTFLCSPSRQSLQVRDTARRGACATPRTRPERGLVRRKQPRRHSAGPRRRRVPTTVRCNRPPVWRSLASPTTLRTQPGARLMLARETAGDGGTACARTTWRRRHHCPPSEYRRLTCAICRRIPVTGQCPTRSTASRMQV